MAHFFNFIFPTTGFWGQFIFLLPFSTKCLAIYDCCLHLTIFAFCLTNLHLYCNRRAPISHEWCQPSKSRLHFKTYISYLFFAAIAVHRSAVILFDSAFYTITSAPCSALISLIADPIALARPESNLFTPQSLQILNVR